jgi:hypothetical protein
MIVPGFLVNWVTFPGVIIHEWAHLRAARWRSLRVHDVNYFSFFGGGYVDRQRAYNVHDQLAVTMAPLAVNTALAALGYAIAIFLFINAETITPPAFVPPDVEFTAALIGVAYLLGWLSFSVAAHALPSGADIRNAWRVARNWWSKSIVAFCSLPLLTLLYLVSWLKFFWIDAVYSLCLGVLCAVAILSATGYAGW